MDRILDAKNALYFAQIESQEKYFLAPEIFF